ncbi:MAG: class I SAM-dependent methyltransferase, partial [Mycobacterium sp.]
EDWPQALRDRGFDAGTPSAWIAEGLIIYLPADAQHQLYSGIDALARSGSHLAIEDGSPMPPEAFAAAVEDERAANARGEPRLFFQLIYNEQCAPAEQWFGERGWTAVPTPLVDYLREVGRPVPGPETEGGRTISQPRLVSGVKA